MSNELQTQNAKQQTAEDYSKQQMVVDTVKKSVFPTATDIDVHIQKIKFKIHGKVGVVQFNYELGSGRFIEIDDSLNGFTDSQPVRMNLK